MNKITSDNRYFVLPWNHDEILKMLQELDTRKLLTPEEYNILINEKGLDNLVTELDTAEIVQRLDEIDSTKAKKDDFEILLSKINQLIRITEDQEEGNLELIDIRNGANGKTYLTAGDAVRNQFKDLNSLVEPILIINENQEEQIYKLKTDSSSLLESYNSKIQETDIILENNTHAINQLNEMNAAQNVRLANIEKVNSIQQIYLNALLDNSDMAKLGKVEYIIQYQDSGELVNPNPKAGEGYFIVDSIKGLTLINLSTAPSRFIVEEDQLYVSDIKLKPNTDYIVKFKCETEDVSKSSVVFETFQIEEHSYNNTPFSVNDNKYNFFTFRTSAEASDCQIKIDCIEQVEIYDLLVMEYVSGLEDIEYFKGSYSTFENFLEDSGKYELTVAIVDYNYNDFIIGQIDIDLTTPLLEYDEIVHYGDIGFCHIHRTIINEDNTVERIEDETQVVIEKLDAVNSNAGSIDLNAMAISEGCSFVVYKRGSLISKDVDAIFSIVPTEKVIGYYDSTMYSAAMLANNIDSIEDQNYEVMAINWDMNYRMSEIQWALEDAGLSQIEGDGLVEPMRFTIVEIAKKLIQAHKYVENIFIKQLDRYLLKGAISKKEHQELMDMINK